MLPAILIANLGFTSIVAFIFSQLASTSPSFLQVWSMPTISSFAASLGLKSIPSLEAWPISFPDSLSSLLSASPVAFPISTTSLHEWDTCEWFSRPAPYSFFQTHLNATGRCRARWLDSNEDGLANGNLNVTRAVEASSVDTMAGANSHDALATSSMSSAIVENPFTMAGTTCSIDDEPHQVRILDTLAIPGENRPALRAPHAPAYRRTTPSPTSPNALVNPLFYITACPAHAQYTLPLLDVGTLPLLNHVGHARDGTDSSSQMLSHIPDDTNAMDARSLPTMLSCRRLERLTAKALIAGLQWTFYILCLGGIFFVVCAYMFALSVVFGMQAIFTSLRRADRLSSPPNSTFFYAVQVSCKMSEFALAFTSTVDVENWSSPNLSMEPFMEPRQIHSELVLMTMVGERLEERSPSLIDWEMTLDTHTALDEPSTISSTSPPPEPLSFNPPPSTPTRPSRRPRARREMSLSMSPSVVSRTRSLSDPFAPPAHDISDLLASPLEGDIQFPEDLDGSFGYGERESSLGLFSSTDGVQSDGSGSIGAEHGQHPSPSTSSLDPVAGDKTDSVLGTLAQSGSYYDDEAAPSLNSNPELLSFSIVQEDLDDDGAEEFANENADESFVESTNFREYFDSRGIKFNYIDIYRPVRTDNEGGIVPLRSTAIILQSEPAMMEYKDMGSGQVTWVPALMATLAIPGSFKATMNRVRMSMMLVTCVAGLISLDPPTLDFGNHQSYWSRIVDIDLSGDPPKYPPFHYEDSNLEDDEHRFELIADDEDSPAISQSSMSSPYGGPVARGFPRRRLLGWTPIPVSSPSDITRHRPCLWLEATVDNLGEGSDRANDVSESINESKMLALPPCATPQRSSPSMGRHGTFPVLDSATESPASGFANNSLADVDTSLQLSNVNDHDELLNSDAIERVVPVLQLSTDARDNIAPEEESVSPSLEIYRTDGFNLIRDQTFNHELGLASSSFAEQSFLGPDASYADELTNEREETPSMISDFSRSVPRSSASPEFPRLSSSLDLGEMPEGDLSLSDAMLFTPPKRSNSEVDSCDSDVIKRCFGSNRGFSSSFTPPRTMAPLPTRKRRPFEPRNDNIERESFVRGRWGS